MSTENSRVLHFCPFISPPFGHDVIRYQPPSLEEIVKVNIKAANRNNAPAQTSKQDIIRTTRDVIKDAEDTNKRKCNIIIHRLEENNKTNKEDQDKEDKITVTDICNTLGVNVDDSDISKCFRLGTKGDRPRPILVTFTSCDKKDLIMKNTKGLKDSDLNIAISHDLTKLQREERRALLAEAKREEENYPGDFKYVVLGPPERPYIKKFPRRK